MNSRLLRSGIWFLPALLLGTVAAHGRTSLWLKQALDEQHQVKSPYVHNDRYLVELQAGQVLNQGVIRNVGPYALVKWDDRMLADILTTDRVKRIEPILRLTPVLDESRPLIELPAVQEVSDAAITGATGMNVLVGIVDSGIDPYHPDFFDANELHTRIVRALDLSTNREWTADDINQGTCTLSDVVGHGTHVAGIATGNGNALPGRQYCGVAPAADLAVVKTSTFGEDEVIEGVDWIYQLASDEGKPAVVNLSLETRMGPHDGTSVFERYLSELTGPGRLLVVAAGNGGDLCIHARTSFPAGETASVYCTTGTESQDFAMCDFWVTANSAPAITAVAPDGGEYEPFTSSQAGRNLGSLGTLYFFQDPQPDPENGRYNTTFYLATGIAVQDWEFRIENMGEGTLSLDAWSQSAEFDSTVCTPYQTVSSPATADSAIAVGALVSRTSWTSLAGGRQYADVPPVGSMATFSNRGPRIDGRRIPHLCAPGMGIMAPRSGQLPTGGYESRISPDGNYLLLEGTSMAAPQVTGALALLLELEPSLSVAAAMADLSASADYLADQSDWDPAAGSGLLNVHALLELIHPEAPNLFLRADPQALTLYWTLNSTGSLQQLNIERVGPTDADTLYFDITDQALLAYGHYLDTRVLTGEYYEYRLLGYTVDGTLYWASSPVGGTALPSTHALAILRYPIPARDEVTLQISRQQEDALLACDLYNVLGQKIWSRNYMEDSRVVEINLSLESCPAGVYFVQVTNGSDKAITRVLKIP